jgi:hypothetical protein
MPRKRSFRRFLGSACALTTLSALVPSSAAAQTTGTPWAAAAGGALGLYSGATLATIGSIVPCTQTYAGPTCVRWSAVGGGAVGMTGGLLLGSADRERVGDKALSAGIGFAAGVLAGLAVRSAAQRVGWADVATLGLVGGAIGSAPRGSAVGLGAGAVIGSLLYLALDGVEEPDALGIALAGLALGGLTEWLVEGIDAQSATSPPLELSVIRVEF